MKNFLTILLILTIISCENNDIVVQDEPQESFFGYEKSLLDINQIIGTWTRSTPIKFGALHGNPAFERGEYHIEVKFENNGEFEHRYTTLGFYENQNPTDSASITIHNGIYSLEDNYLHIIRNSRTYIQIYDGESINRDTSTRTTTIQHEYQWPNVAILNNDSLRFKYHTITDVISSDQIAPGIELREETYKRK